MATLRAHNSTEYWKKTDLRAKPDADIFQKVLDGGHFASAV